MNCKEAKELLDAYRTEELGSEQGRHLRGHLEACMNCARELAEIERFASETAGHRIPAPPEILRNVLDAAADGFGEVHTEIGGVFVAFNARGITMVQLGGMSVEAFSDYYERRRGRRARPTEVPEAYVRVVQQAAAGQPPDSLPVNLEGLSPFEREVLNLLTKIPRGEVRPYRWLAREAGRPKAVRAVGNTMARNPVPLLLPCHRVVPTQGGVGNYAFGSQMKRDLLKREGVPIEELDDLAKKGVRFLGCRSTRIYCFPTCKDARRMLPANRVPFAAEQDAHDAGYRPCKHCRPEALAS